MEPGRRICFGPALIHGCDRAGKRSAWHGGSGLEPWGWMDVALYCTCAVLQGGMGSTWAPGSRYRHVVHHHQSGSCSSVGRPGGCFEPCAVNERSSRCAARWPDVRIDRVVVGGFEFDRLPPREKGEIAVTHAGAGTEEYSSSRAWPGTSLSHGFLVQLYGVRTVCNTATAAAVKLYSMRLAAG
jgi:hypothetical protein